MVGFTVVVAFAGKSRAMGKDGKLPWNIKRDMQRFKEVTSAVPSPDKKNAVIMGRNTWASIPAKFRPLPGRINVILSRNPECASVLGVTPSDDLLVCGSLQDALTRLSAMSAVHKVFVIGGQNVYAEALESPRCEKLLVTSIEEDVPDCDVFFPMISAEIFRLTTRSTPEREGEFTFRFAEYDAIADGTLAAGSQLSPPLPPALNTTLAVSSSSSSSSSTSSLASFYANAGVTNVEEVQYLLAIDDILRTGVHRGDRTGTGTISKFGMQMRYSLRNEVFPLLTTKRVFWRGLAEELLWFIKGSTNANELAVKGKPCTPRYLSTYMHIYIYYVCTFFLTPR